jgi:DNA-directed RNA polymerase specialized sigma24 family protein
VSAGEVGVSPADLKDSSAFVGMFDAHAVYLYDYCLSLIGNEAEAASATRVTLVAAFMLGGRLREPDRQRAWLFALARRECLSDMPTRRQPWIAVPKPAAPVPSVNRASTAFAEADTSELPRQGFEAEIRRAVRILAHELAPRRDLRREVLLLVHRYGIVPSELPAILDISPDAAQDLLAAARGMHEESLDAPLATLPASVWRETADVIFGADQREYREAIAADAGRLWAEGLPEEPATPPSTRKLALTSAGLAAALLAPAALGAGAYVLFAASPAAATRGHVIVTRPTATPAPSTSVPDRTVAHSTKTKVHHKTTHHSRVSVHSLPTTKPATTASARPPHTSKPTSKPTSSAPVIGPSPTTSTSPTSPGPSDHSSSPSPPPSSSSSPPPSSSA